MKQSGESKITRQIEMCGLYFSLATLQIRGLRRAACGTNLMDNNVCEKDMCFKPQPIQECTSGTRNTCS